MGDRLSAARTTFVGSRARVNLIAAAGNILAIARKARATVTLTMSALAHLFVVGTRSVSMATEGGTPLAKSARISVSGEISDRGLVSQAL